MNGEKTRIIAPRTNGLNEPERLRLGELLLKAGFAVRLGSEKDGKTTRQYVEYWVPGKPGVDDG